MAAPEPRSNEARGLLAGLAFALILTAIPFGLVAFGWLSSGASLAFIALAAILQILVHLRFFLRLSLTDTSRERLLALAFATILIVFMVGGSLWVLFDLQRRMAM